MTNSYTCSRCGCVHWDELKPISCIMCDNDIFYDSPDDFYDKETLSKQTNYVKETDDAED